MKNKVIIAGSRDIDDCDLVFELIKHSRIRIDEIVCGQAAGVDTCGMYYGFDHMIPIKYFPANWKKHGKAAGPIRNSEMVEYCTHGIYVINNHSSGSMDCLRKIKASLKPFIAYHLINGILHYVETNSEKFDEYDLAVDLLRRSLIKTETTKI